MDRISTAYAADRAAIGSAQSEPVVSVRGLVKRYGGHEVVAGNLSLTGPAATKEQR
jgi:hypothetical protein